jgi:hypothetical protein
MNPQQRTISSIINDASLSPLEKVAAQLSIMMTPDYPFLDTAMMHTLPLKNVSEKKQTKSVKKKATKPKKKSATKRKKARVSRQPNVLQLL